MKKLLLSGSIAVLLLPALVFAGADDVTLAEDVALSVNGITLNVSGSTATIESIVVDSGSFRVTLQSGSAFEITAPNLNQLSANNATWQSVNTCTGSASVLGFDVQSEVIVTITPSATLCADTAVATATSKGDARGGGSTTPVTPIIAPVTLVAQVANAEAIAAIRTQLISLIQQLIVLLQQEIANM